MKAFDIDGVYWKQLFNIFSLYPSMTNTIKMLHEWINFHCVSYSLKSFIHAMRKLQWIGSFNDEFLLVKNSNEIDVVFKFFLIKINDVHAFNSLYYFTAMKMFFLLIEIFKILLQRKDLFTEDNKDLGWFC